MCGSCIPYKGNSERFLQHVKCVLQESDAKYSVAVAFEFVDELFNDGYDDETIFEFYRVFQTHALAWARPEHWDQIDARMQRILGIQAQTRQIGYERAYPVIEHQRPMKDITPQRPRLAYAR